MLDYTAPFGRSGSTRVNDVCCRVVLDADGGYALGQLVVQKQQPRDRKVDVVGDVLRQEVLAAFVA